jgi:hypothetical protein
VRAWNRRRRKQFLFPSKEAEDNEIRPRHARSPPLYHRLCPP